MFHSNSLCFVIFCRSGTEFTEVTGTVTATRTVTYTVESGKNYILHVTMEKSYPTDASPFTGGTSTLISEERTKQDGSNNNAYSLSRIYLVTATSTSLVFTTGGPPVSATNQGTLCIVKLYLIS